MRDFILLSFMLLAEELEFIFSWKLSSSLSSSVTSDMNFRKAHSIFYSAFRLITGLR